MDGAGEFLKAVDAVRTGRAEDWQARQVLVLAPVVGQGRLRRRAAAILSRTVEKGPARVAGPYVQPAASASSSLTSRILAPF